MVDGRSVAVAVAAALAVLAVMAVMAALAAVLPVKPRDAESLRMVPRRWWVRRLLQFGCNAQTQFAQGRVTAPLFCVVGAVFGGGSTLAL